MRVIQLLNWKLESIEKELDAIKEQGFDAIQINPMQPFKEEKIFKWYWSYQPLGFRIGNMFGSKEDLTRLCQKAREKGLDIVVDVVLNHMANMSDDKPCIPHEKVDPILRNNKKFWKEPCLVVDNNDRKDAVTHCIGLPGLDLRNKELQTIIKGFLKELKDCGVSGFRFDAAKHIGLPSDGVDFFEKVHDFLKDENLYGYGEILHAPKDWNDEMSKYIYVHMSFGGEITNINKVFAFRGSHDDYLNLKPDHTRNLTDKELIYSYKTLTDYYPNTLVYVRPLDEDGPYCKNKDNLTYDEVYKLNEKEYFNRLYFESEIIKNINNGHMDNNYNEEHSNGKVLVLKK